MSDEDVVVGIETLLARAVESLSAGWLGRMGIVSVADALMRTDGRPVIMVLTTAGNVRELERLLPKVHEGFPVIVLHSAPVVPHSGPQLPIIELWDMDDGFVVVARLGDVEFRRGYGTYEAARAAQDMLVAELAPTQTDSDVGRVLVEWVRYVVNGRGGSVGPAESFGKVE